MTDSENPAGEGGRGEAVAGRPAEETWVLRLYVAGMTPRSRLAIRNLRALCEKHLPGRHEISVFDVFQQKALAKEAGIVAAPTLVKTSPPPVRRLIGDLSKTGAVLRGLGLDAG